MRNYPTHVRPEQHPSERSYHGATSRSHLLSDIYIVKNSMDLIMLEMFSCLLTVNPTFWDCRNPDHNCNGGKCTSKGTCDCSSLTDRAGYDCTLDAG